MASQDTSPDVDQSVQPSPEPLSVLLARNRNELMYELRRISHKCKPVSGRDQRGLLEALLQRRRQVGGEATSAKDLAFAVKSAALATNESESCSDTSSNDQPSFRPNSIVLEVRGLFEQRPVSTLLESTFRPSLERALRQSERHRRRRLRPTPAPRRRGPQPAVHVAGRSRSPRSRSNRSSSSTQSSGLQAQLEQAQREEILLELNELVQQQVVSHVLSGEFHGVLELHLQDRLQRTGVDGQRVQDFIQTLPGRRAGGGEATGGHFGASYRELVEKVDSMKSEMDELRRLVRLSFDLQLDVQRSLRQQLAAIGKAVVEPQPLILPAKQAMAMPQKLTSVTSSVSESRAVSRGQCVVCSAEQCDTVLYSCGHLCVCSCCALDLRNGPTPICPICRAPIQDVVRVYEV